MSAAWQLIQFGHDVTVYDDAEKIGGKLAQVIPHSRMPQEILQAELNRIEKLGVKFITNCKVDKNIFEKICSDSDAVLVSTSKIFQLGRRGEINFRN